MSLAKRSPCYKDLTNHKDDDVMGLEYADQMGYGPKSGDFITSKRKLSDENLKRKYE